MADLRIDQVSKHFGQTAAVQGLNLEVGNGEFFALLGPSGAGKTTTLRLVAGLETPDRGQVFIDGQDVTQRAPALRDVAFVFQQYSLYPHLSVYENLAFPLRSPLRKTPDLEIRAKVKEVASLLRIEDKLQNSATQLSGGEMQRVAIGRALVRNPALYLMDEPLSSLDAKLRNDLRLELKRIQHDTQATTLYVTHDQVEALTLATRIGVLDQGKLVQVGTPQQLYEDPISVVAASRLGSPRINLLPRTALAHLQLPEQVATLGVRAEHIRVSRPDSLNGTYIQARVDRLERLSEQCLMHLSLLGSEFLLIASIHSDHLARPGEVIYLQIAHSLWFDTEGHRVRP